MKRYYFLFLLFLFLLQSCARQGSPGGGPKDESPPRLILASPPNESVHFSANHVSLLFDEFIVLKNKNAAISSPHLPMRFKVKKKQLIIFFEDSLKANTTYNINFAGHIADLNEGNILNGLSYAFSTGDQLDSLRIRGRVTDALTGEKKEGILIALYKNLSDSAFLGDPDFLAYSSKEGDFEIRYLSPGSYRLAAFVDRNRNLRYDPYKEDIAYLFDTLTLSHDSTLPALRLSPEINPRPEIGCQPFGPGSFRLISDRPLLPGERFQLFSGKGTLRSVSADSSLLFLHSPPDSLKLRFLSFGGDTFPVHCSLPASFPKGDIIKEKSNKDYFIIIFNSLVLYVLSDFQLISENDTLRIKPEIHNDSLFLPISPDSLAKYRSLKIADSSVLFINNQLNDKEISLSVKAPIKHNSTLVLLVPDDSAAAEQKIIVLKSPNHEIRKILPAGQHQIRFEELAPGSYLLRIIIDKNRNGSWDAGSLILKEEAERLYIYPQTINIKPDWEQELEIKL